MLTLASRLLLSRRANLACGSAQSYCPPLFWSRMWLFLDSVWMVRTGVYFVDVGHRSASDPWLSRTELASHLAVFTCACQDTLDYGSRVTSSGYLLERNCNWGRGPSPWRPGCFWSSDLCVLNCSSVFPASVCTIAGLHPNCCRRTIKEPHLKVAINATVGAPRPPHPADPVREVR